MKELLLLFPLLIPQIASGQARPPFPLVERPPVPCDTTGSPQADYRLSKDNPAVFISFERVGPALDPLAAHLFESGNAKISQGVGSDFWLRLRNNSVWAISLRTYGT